ncbi:hypothetical protein ACFXG4_08530 [Nocardia sp. NPDC059246]|uniref:hypothetical protein n=1 Tax=unclassified Nocardia TaxID=2637762 RepID=UPI0036A577DA
MQAAAHPARGGAAAATPVLSLAAVGTAAYVRALADYFRLIGRPLPDLRPGPESGTDA